MKIQIINGPNLNLLGQREPGIYGDESFESYLPTLQAKFPGVEIACFQSNVEGELINKMQQVGFFEGYDGIVLNAGAYTHTSVALHDCIRSLKCPVIEVHIHLRRLSRCDLWLRTRRLPPGRRRIDSPLSEIEDYILRHTEPEPDYLYRLWRATNIHTIHGRMASGHLQGRLLKMLVRMIRPATILEVGTFSGYSAISMAEGLDEGGRLYTFEINDEMEDFTRPWIEGSPVADKIEFIIGDALTEAPKLGIQFDMAFIDGDKRTYRECYEMVLSILRPGGFILADNTLWDGHVVDHAYDHDRQTQGIETFNDYIAADDRVEQVILPLRDGLTLIRKK